MDLKVGEQVDLRIGRQGKIGFHVLINEAYEGMLYKNELYQRIEEGAKMIGYVKNIREDGKVDVSLQAIGFKRTIVKNEIIILNALKENDGLLDLSDKSSPEDIKFRLGMSKKAFKNAIGGLFRQKLILISEDGVKLIDQSIK